MRKPPGNPRSERWGQRPPRQRALSRRAAVLLGAIVLLPMTVSRGGRALGQIQEPTPLPTPTQPGQPTSRVPFSTGPDIGQDPALYRAQLEAGRRRNIERQNRMVSDTDKIVRLAQDLCSTMDSGKKDLSPAALAKKSEEIEKLARGVRERMVSE